MIKIIRKLNPFSSYEIEYMESWLCDMAKQGLFVDSIILCFASFEKHEPRNRRYRILPNAYGAASDEEKDFYSQHDWNFAFSTSGLNVFYTDNEDAEELFTDAASFRFYTKKYVAWAIVFILVMIYWLYVITKDGLGLFDFSYPPLHLLNDIGIIMAIFSTLLSLLIIISIIRLIIRSIMLIKNIKKNISLRHDIPYKRVAKFNNTLTVLILISLIGLPVGMIASHNFPSTVITYAETKAYQGTHPVMFKEIDEKNGAVVQECLDKNQWLVDHIDISYTIDSYSDGLFANTVNEDVRFLEDDQETIVYIATYYHARFAAIAQHYLKEDIPYTLGKNFNMDDIKIECDSVDYAGYYFDDEDSYQYLFVLNDKQLEAVVYHGDKNPKDYLQLYADDISNK